MILDVDLAERRAGDHRRHPWEVARADFYCSRLAEFKVLRARTWLDVGAGDAWFAGQLSRLTPRDASITCWDINYSDDDVNRPSDAFHAALKLTRHRPDEPSEVILMLDVVEHVEDDVGFLATIVDDLLLPGGHVLFSVPAYPWLFTEHDRLLHHFRRYSPRDARALLTSCGLDIVSEGGLFHSLLAPRFAQRLLELVAARPRGQREPAGIGSWERGARVTSALTAALTLESKASAWLSRRNVMLPGLSYWALCRARSTE